MPPASSRALYAAYASVAAAALGWLVLAASLGAGFAEDDWSRGMLATALAVCVGVAVVTGLVAVVLALTEPIERRAAAVGAIGFLVAAPLASRVAF